MPQITVIIPTYKRAKLVVRGIQSALRQSYGDFKICVYDNASDDGTETLVRELADGDSRVQYFCHEQNLGASRNLVFALGRVNTPFFTILPDDDLLLPNCFQLAMESLKKYPLAGLYAGAVMNTYESGEFIDVGKFTHSEEEYKVPPEGLYQMISAFSIWTGIVFRKEVIQSIKAFDHSIVAGDIDFMNHVAAQFPYVISRKPVAIFVHSSESYSYRVGLKVIWPSWVQIVKRLNEMTCLTESEKQIAQECLSSKFRGLLWWASKRDILRKETDELLRIGELLAEMPESKRRGERLILLSRLCKKSPLFRWVFLLAATQYHHLLKLFKNSATNLHYREYEKEIKLAQSYFVGG